MVETRLAKLDLSSRIAALDDAQAEVRRIAQSLSDEGATADGAAFAAWLPRIRADALVAQAKEGRAREALARAQAGLASAQAAQRVVGEALARRAAERRREDLLREQLLLDDLGRPRG